MINFSSTTNFELTLVVRFKAVKWYTLEIIALPGKGLSIDLSQSASFGPMRGEKSNG